MRKTDAVVVVSHTTNGAALKNQNKHHATPTVSAWLSFSCSQDINSFLVRTLYAATTCLSLFMVGWILVVPASWLMGRWKWHDDLIYAYFERKKETALVVPESITKYARHGDVQILHTLAGAIWAGAIPFQLHPNSRKYNKTLHRCIGYVFFGTSLSISVGLLLMQVKKITYLDDYSDLPPVETWPHPVFLMNFALLWFFATAVVALRKAMQRQFETHQEYVFRHVGAGIWVAIQRLLLPVLNPRTRMEQRAAFGDAAFYGMAITTLAAELGIYLVRQEGKLKKLSMTTKKAA